MAPAGSSRVARWRPPPRPDWVARVNAAGENMNLRQVVPLDEQSLIDSATQTSGLTDFGQDDWRDAFGVMCRALDGEARLNLLGRLLTRTEILLALEARLRIEDTYRRHPEIEDEEIVRPLLILGQGRSGTTALQNLLAADPSNESVRVWEAMYPCPPPEADTYFDDPRIARANSLTDLWAQITPELRSVHDFTASVPTESIHTQTMSFRMPAFIDPIWGQVSSFTAYLADKDIADAYRYEKRVLKLLQWRNPRKRWILKSPYALSHLPKVREVFPDVGFIWTHRDPVRAVASVVSLIGILSWVRSDHPHAGNTLEMLTDSTLTAQLMSQPIEWLENGTIPPDCLCNVQYQDLIRQPMKVIEHIYDFFGMPLTADARTAIEQFMSDNPRSGRPGHEYELGDEEEIRLERIAFARYQDYFGVPEEV